MIEGALNVDSAKEFESGKITATVTYNTRYIHSNGEPVCITFSLGATVSVNAIIGLPILTGWKNDFYILTKIKHFQKLCIFGSHCHFWMPLFTSRSIMFQCILLCQKKE